MACWCSGAGLLNAILLKQTWTVYWAHKSQLWQSLQFFHGQDTSPVKLKRNESDVNNEDNDQIDTTNID